MCLNKTYFIVMRFTPLTIIYFPIMAYFIEEYRLLCKTHITVRLLYSPLLPHQNQPLSQAWILL